MEKEERGPIYSPYLVQLPITRFANIAPLDDFEVTMATSPGGAVTNVISRSCGIRNPDEKGIAIGTAVNYLKSKMANRDISQYAFEVQDVIFDETGVPLFHLDPAYQEARRAYFAEELTKDPIRYSENPENNWGIAKKLLEHYDSLR